MRSRSVAHPSLSCRTSPPRVGRLAVLSAFANRQRCRKGVVREAANLPLEGEMSPKATEGVGTS
ncbi:MAG: hypothetical protein EOR48_29610 [Mesorhizobium sp.]|nr:MAG: hypothetical protein EOR48_29610 [Mesorhizobium sp.]TIP45697.1 MAG: hypothetical protein E5X62_12080 [Mesorhizobium sp.]